MILRCIDNNLCSSLTLNKEYYIQKINERKQLKQQKLDAKISKLQQEKEELEDKSEKAS